MTITTEFVTFVLLIISVIGGAWWRIEGRLRLIEHATLLRVESATSQAHLIAAQLAEYKTHVAELYITKAGLRETTEQIMTAMDDIKLSVSGFNSRMDRIIEDRPRRQTA